MKNLKVFVVEHSGVWMGGYSVVVAHNEEDARAAFNDEVRICATVPAIYKVYAIDTKAINVKVVWNGDY